jgi:hypothetical protein
VNHVHDKACPIDFDNVQPWKRYLRWIFRLVISIAAVYEILFGGQKFFGSIALLALTILILPRFFTRNRICLIPVEIEILFLMVVFLELILADANSFYSKIPYYDKFMHSLVSMIIGLIGMMIIYTFYALDKLKASTAVMFAIIVLITIGMGAILEMVEFIYDQLLYPIVGQYLPTGLTQGSMASSAFIDTMEDLYFDTLGGILGAALGVFFISRAKNRGEHLELVDEIEVLAGDKK